jgi:hypothetical protein
VTTFRASEQPFWATYSWRAWEAKSVQPVVKSFWPRRNYCNYLQVAAISCTYLRYLRYLQRHFFSHDLATLPSGRARHSVRAAILATWNLEPGTWNFFAQAALRRAPNRPKIIHHPPSAPRPFCNRQSSIVKPVLRSFRAKQDRQFPEAPVNLEPGTWNLELPPWRGESRSQREKTAPPSASRRSDQCILNGTESSLIKPNQA